MMEHSQLLKIKEGDLVWVGNRYSERVMVQSVVRVTNTLIVLNGDRKYNTYKREHGHAHSRNYSLWGEKITGFAREIDLKKLNKEEAKRKAKTAARDAEQKQQEALRQELSNLLPGDLHIQSYNTSANGDGPVESYGISGLSEKQVRNIAQFLKRKDLQRFLSPRASGIFVHPHS